jgi:hypothetical protein
MSRNFVEGTKVRIATREEILKMGDMDIVKIRFKDEDFFEVQGKNSSKLIISSANMGRAGMFKEIDYDGDAVVIFGKDCEVYSPEELLIPVEDEVETPTSKEIEKSDKKIIRFENVEPYFKLSDEQIKLLKVLDEYGLLSESYNFADEVEIIEV